MPSNSFLNGVGGKIFEPFPNAWMDVGCPCCEDDPNDDFPELEVRCNKEAYLERDLEVLLKSITQKDKLCKVAIYIDPPGQEQIEIRLKFVNTTKYPNDCDSHDGVKEKQIEWNEDAKKAIVKMFELTFGYDYSIKVIQ